MSKKAASGSSRSRNREATEQRLIDACETILLSHGPEGIGVNRVVEEAGVGKQLLYRYFDDLPGLVTAWLERGANWPTADEIVGKREQFDKLSYKDKVKSIQRNYLKALRKRPVITRLMASELMNPTAVTSVLESASDKIGRELAQIMAELEGGQQEDLVELSLIFYCMFNYLAMRSVTSPVCFGMDLKKKKSWDRIDGVIDTVVDRYLD
jgi:AcrR family transcriptional regulator